MKKIAITLAASLLLSTTVAQAISITGEAGQHYTNLGVGFGTTTSGLAFTGNWSHSDNDGDTVGLGLGLNVPLIGTLMGTVGGKAVYLAPKDRDNGYALAVGGGLQWPIGDRVTLFGEGYYSPDSLSSSVQNYVEANAGMRVNVIPLLSVDVGYRYIMMAGKDGDRDNTLADGAYIGGSVNF